MSDGIDALNDCGCCEGADTSVPAALENAPGLPAIAYRAGTWAEFRESFAARLSSADFPALAGLRARSDDDFTIAFGDACAVMADVLTFYQERIANEAFLRTAVERRSVLELARLIGYTLAPGVAADAWFAFTLEEARGLPAQAARAVAVPAGTKVQSVPGPDEAPQTFETVGEVEARVERNAIRAQTRAPQAIAHGQKALYLEGTGHQLQPGEIILIVGAERTGFTGAERWDVRLLQSVEADDRRKLTRIAWAEGLGHEGPHVEPAADRVEVFVFRQRAGLFGHNAPDPRLLSTNGTNLAALANPSTGEWFGFVVQGQAVDLDQSYPKIVAGSWLALVNAAIPPNPPSLPGYVELYRARTVAQQSRSAFGLAAKVTHVELDTAEHLSSFGLRDTLVLAQSERLPLAERPVREPVYGDRIALATLVPELGRGQAIAVNGKRQHVRVAPGAKNLSLAVPGAPPVSLAPGDRLALAAPPTRMVAGSPQQLSPAELVAALAAPNPPVLTWTLRDRDARTGTLVTSAGNLDLDAARDEDETAAEIAFLAASADAVESDRDRTHLRLAAPLEHCYDRETVAINANVAPATHGETVSELAGSGDSSARDQQFPLKQAPVTHVSADTPSGRLSTLQVRVNDVLWQERATLFAAGPTDRAYATRTDDEGRTTIVFGDGNEGARLPTGQQNVRATYRKGIGFAGNVRAGQLTTLLTRPLGVTGVTNPEPASGGEDAETLDGARRNAPLTVLTLERAVSRRDYEDFARSFAGVAKAHAVWIATGPARGVFLTVAGPGGAAIDETGKTHAALVGALHRYGDPLMPLAVRTYRPATFLLGATVKIAEDALQDKVVAAVRTALVAAFAFDAREFGQTVAIDEIVAVMHGVAGVVAVDVNDLRRLDDGPVPRVRARLFAARPAASDTTIAPAEMLTLDAAALTLGVMP